MKGDFLWAVSQMKEGKKVKRKDWGTRYLYYDTIIKSNYAKPEEWYVEHFEATDWEIVDDDDDIINHKHFIPSTIEELSSFIGKYYFPKQRVKEVLDDVQKVVDNSVYPEAYENGILNTLNDIREKLGLEE